MARMLLSHGAEPDAPGGLVGGALHVAAGTDLADDRARDKMLCLLLNYGADPNLDIVFLDPVRTNSAVGVAPVGAGLVEEAGARRMTALRSPFAEYMRSAAPENSVEAQTVAKFLASGAKVSTSVTKLHF